jgi:hypothetical protein
MSKRCGWILLLLILLYWTGCGRTSEAKVNVTNTGELAIKVAISYSTSEIAPGKSDTFTLTWPGRDTMDINLLYFPVGQPARSEYRELELNPGDVLDLNLGFSKN